MERIRYRKRDDDPKVKPERERREENQKKMEINSSKSVFITTRLSLFAPSSIGLPLAAAPSAFASESPEPSTVPWPQVPDSKARKVVYPPSRKSQLLDLCPLQIGRHRHGRPNDHDKALHQGS